MPQPPPPNSQPLPPETLRRFQAFRRLLDLPEFTDEFLPGIEAEQRDRLANMAENAPEADLRRQFIRWKFSMEIARDASQFVEEVERRIGAVGKGATGSTL